MSDYKEGDFVRLKTAEREVEGTLMPSNGQDSIIIKLKNGYNLGFNKDEVKGIDTIKKKTEEKPLHKEIKEKKGLKTIALLHTGGTITSRVDYTTGGVISQTSPDALVALYPEIKDIANIRNVTVTNLMSEDITFKDYQKIAKAVKENADVDGIIITHGTDTLTMTAAALSFMFESIDIPVLLVGSQRSSDRGSADSAMNLICAAEFIVKTDYAGFAVCMHHTVNDDVCAILPATKCRKMHTSRRDSFRAINDTPIALVDYETRKIEYLKDYSKKIGKKTILKDKMSTDVGLIKMHPNIKDSLFEFYTKNYKAFIMENTGMGHAPTNTEENMRKYELLKKFIERGGIVGITTQCLYGRVHPDVYSNLRRLSDIGCVFCEDMLPETAYIKLSWLLANYPEDEVKILLNSNIRGEITERTKKENFVE